MAPLIILLLACLAVAWLGRNRRFGFLGTFIVSVVVSPLVMILALLMGDAQKPARDDQKR